MIKVTDLTKYYGENPAVTDLSFEMEGSHVYGFLGPNGAGKSTTMNMITGCLSPTSGRIEIGGHDLLEEPEEARKLIGYLPEQPPLYPNETPLEYLTFIGEAKGLRGPGLREKVMDVILRTGLENVYDQLIRTLSKGYKQRVGIAQALLGDPPLIILDEPTVGLDPLQIIEIRELIRELGESHTVIFSSHILSEVQAICEKVLIISGGKLIAFDTPENLEKAMGSSASLHLTFAGEPDDAMSALSGLVPEETCGIEELPDGDHRLTVSVNSEELRELTIRLFYAFAEAKLPILELSTRRANLEEVFIELIEEGDDEDAVDIQA